MAENWREALASLRVLVCIAKADGSLSSSDQEMLRAAFEQLEPLPQPITWEQLLTEDIPITELLQDITTPDTQEALYNAARSLIEPEGTHPGQQQLFNQMQTAFYSSPKNVSDDSSYKSLVAGIQIVAQHNRRVRNLVLDYALGAAVIGLIPVPGLLIIQIITLVFLMIKMRRNIGALWGFPKGHDILAFVGTWFGSLGALAIALMAWLTLLGIGVFVPFVDSLARAAAFATLVWAQGQVTNQFYNSSRRMDQLAFQRSVQRSAQSQRSRSSNGQI